MSMNSDSQETQVVVVGAGIIGLINALQYARRNIDVVLIDNLVGHKRSYKVGESLLVFSNMFLRTVGGLDEHLMTESSRHRRRSGRGSRLRQRAAPGELGV
jgi:2-polyprenyl-6-methoxyphenol hydroxylase-like FAD-dependent oxidoreductase